MLQVYDRVLASRSIPTLVAISLLVAGLYVFYAFLEWIRSRMAVRYGGLIDEAVSADLFQVAVRQRLAPGGGQTSDPVRDLDSLRQFVAGPGPMALMDLPWLPFYMVIVFLLHPALGWLATIGAVIITLMLVVNEFTSQKPSQETNIAANRRQNRTDDAKANAEAVVAMGMLGAITKRWTEGAKDLVDAQRNAADKAAFYSSVTKAFRFLLQSAVLGVGAYLVIINEVSGGVMIAASILTSRALAPVEQVVAQWRGFVGARQALTRINAILRNSFVPPRLTDLPLPSRTLVVTNLATGPDRNRRPLVGNVTFNLKGGEGLGILGLSGSGKSSLVRAVVGVWPVLQGEVRFDGSELSHYDQERIGQAIGYLPQTVELFDGTIAENIARFRDDATTDQVLAAAKAARIHDLIASLPDGYDTRLGERGATLSVGQRQRVGLARALYGDPFLVVLDEPNSNLDAEGDQALTDALNVAKQRGAVVIVVAHRPSAIAAVDKLLFLQNGRQSAFGPKDEVLRQITQQPTVVGGNRVGAR
jgi:ATP-binding cassette subfamily C protein PrsD